MTEELRHFFKELVLYLKSQLSQTKVTDIVFSILSVALGLYLSWPATAALAFGLLVWTLLNPVSSKLTAKATVVVLLVVGALLGAGKADRAETVASLGYYLLAITVVMAVLELRRGPSNDDQPQS